MALDFDRRIQENLSLIFFLGGVYLGKKDASPQRKLANELKVIFAFSARALRLFINGEAAQEQTRMCVCVCLCGLHGRPWNDICLSLLSGVVNMCII